MYRRNMVKHCSNKYKTEEDNPSINDFHNLNANKINELHQNMKTYFQHDDMKNVQSIFPQIKRMQSEIKQYEKDLNELDIGELSIKNRKELLEKKNSLLSKIKKMMNQLAEGKKQIQKYKFQRENLRQEIENKKTILFKLRDYEESKNETNFKLVLPLLQKSKKVHTDITQVNRKARRQSILFFQETPQQQAIKDILYTQKNQIKSTYQKWKQVQALLSLITSLPTSTLENRLFGDQNVSITKKIFKNHSMDQYFKEMMKDPTVKKELQKITNLIK